MDPCPPPSDPVISSLDPAVGARRGARSLSPHRPPALVTTGSIKALSCNGRGGTRWVVDPRIYARGSCPPPLVVDAPLTRWPAGPAATANGGVWGSRFGPLGAGHAAPRWPTTRLRRPHQRTPCSDRLPSTSKVASLQLVKTLPIISGISSSASSAWMCFCRNLEYG